MIQLKKTILNNYFILTLFAFVVSTTSVAQKDFKIITQDALNFWEAFDALKQGADTAEIFQKLVIDRASEPFKKFIKKANIQARNYTAQVRKYPRFYQSVRANSLRLINSEKEIRLLIKKFQDIYPAIIPADICIAFGNFYTGGTIYVDSKTKLVYIGLEYHGLDSSAVVSEFNSVTRDYLTRSNFYRTIIHELVHVQQETHGSTVTRSYYGNKIVHAILREGIPDFIAKLIYPDGNDGRYVEYGLKHEASLKQKLKAELWQSDKSHWIYNSKTADDRPADLGYFMGSRIANAYFEKNRNKNVIRQIIEISDVKKFIKESGYFSN